MKKLCLWYFTDQFILQFFFYFHKNRNVKQSFRETILMKVLFCELQLEYIHKVRGGLRRVESKLMMTIIKRQFFIRPGIANVNTERILCSLFHVYCWLFWKYLKIWTWFEIIWPLPSNYVLFLLSKT